uniref:Uncharacterized protein n=1 Tax=Globisporangium ultimum (strain ATCC 200006 / CBS 805.95 / DAOM BR144) TaxID=431595 RepID=K3WVN5_GLOUD
MVRWSVVAALYSAAVILILPLANSETTSNNPSGADQSIPIYNPQPNTQPQGSDLANINPTDFQPDVSEAANDGQMATTAEAGALLENRATPTPSPAPSDTTSTPNNVTPAPTPTMAVRCVDGQVEMSVENVPGIFCAKGPKICSGSISDGNCPGIQAGLGYGSHCGVVRTGIYGCLKGSATTI